MADKVGFIGLGNMGKPMAVNLAKAGMDLTVMDLNPEPVEDLKNLGAKAVQTTRELGAQCDIVEIVVMNDRQVIEVISGKAPGEGLLAGMKPGSLIIIHSTVLPETCQQMAEAAAEKQVGLIDVAVSGAEAGSIEGTLTLIVGGDEANIARARPIFDIVGEQVFHMGGIGMGQAAKLCNNIMALVNLQVVEEALALAVAAGIDEEKMVEISKVSTGDSWALRSVLPMRKLIARASHGGGKPSSKLAYKDLILAVKFGKSLDVPVDITGYTVDRARPEK